jgi:hypothetical protein
VMIELMYNRAVFDILNCFYRSPLMAMLMASPAGCPVPHTTPAPLHVISFGIVRAVW